MPSTFTRSARRVIPMKSAILAGAALPRRRMVHPAAASHQRRRADDVDHGPAITSVPQKARVHLAKSDRRFMNDWQAGDETARAKPTSAFTLWYSQPCLLATLWGRLPSAPRK